jgi:3-oxoacyl-[acyl-carrier protein] reductase
MEFGIAGKTAIVCASSRGLGKGCAQALAKEGVNIILNGRDAAVLDATLAQTRKLAKGEVHAVVADVTTEEGRQRLLDACPNPDIVVNNAGGPPPGDFRDWRKADWDAAVNANMFTPIEMIRRTVDGMAERGFGRIINITSSSVKSPIATLGLSNGARSGLTGFVAGCARQVASTGVTINNILPGRFDTDRLRGGNRYIAEQSGRSFEEQMALGAEQIPARRYGHPDEFGALCAYLCSQQAAFITAQNIVIDGGMIGNST